MNELSDAGRRRFATGAAKRRVWLGARRRGNAAPPGDNARRRDSPMHGAGACGRGAGASEEGLEAAPPALENASLALFGAFSRTAAVLLSRFRQDFDPKTYMYTSSGRKDAENGQEAAGK